MFTRIQSTGIGPHTDLDLTLSPTGRTVIELVTDPTAERIASIV